MKSKKTVCAKCGRIAFKAGFCESHWIEKQNLFEIKPFSLKICKHCWRWYDGKWHNAEKNIGITENIVSIAAKKRICALGDINNINIECYVSKTPREYVCIISASGSIEGSRKFETRKIAIPVLMVKCDNCVRISGNYHEAVIQIRGHRAGKIVKDAEFVLGSIPSWVKHLKYGWDIYFINKGDARDVIGVLKRFHYDVVPTYKLVGKKDGKNLYRDFYAVR